MMMPMLQAKNVNYARNDISVLNDINFHLHSGEVLQLVGHNGSGKTTLLKILATLLKPQQGEVLWQGKSIHSHAEYYCQDMSYLGHLKGIKKDLTVLENLNFNWKETQSSYATIHSSLDAMNLNGLENQLVRYLSQGQQQRTAFAKLILSKTKLWLLDEPFASIDRAGNLKIEQLIEKHCDNGGIVIITAHQTIQWEKMPLRVLQL
jgi:heme exporter protein A